jgi:hypothetical protein
MTDVAIMLLVLLLVLVLLLLCVCLLLLCLCLLVLTCPHARLLWRQAALLLLLVALHLLRYLVKAVKQVAAGWCTAACLRSVLLPAACDRHK